MWCDDYWSGKLVVGMTKYTLLPVNLYWCVLVAEIIVICGDGCIDRINLWTQNPILLYRVSEPAAPHSPHSLSKSIKIRFKAFLVAGRLYRVNGF